MHTLNSCQSGDILQIPLSAAI